MSIDAAQLDDRFEPARRLADAVLYEGYVLYPYRASSGKNQCRWQFGVLAPRPFSEADGSEPWTMQTECVAEVGADSALEIRVRALQVQTRQIEQQTNEQQANDQWMPIQDLEVDGRLWTGWDEAIEQQIDLLDIRVDALTPTERTMTVELPGGRETEILHTAAGAVAGRVVRERRPVTCRVTMATTPVAGPYPLIKVLVTVDNETDWRGEGADRDEVVRHSLVAVHTLMAVDGGAFISLLDPPEFARPTVAQCRNVRTFPILAGSEGRRDLMLSSPIILYDHAEVAPESQGDFCDATEIDEILALRVMTLTDEEKREARATDPRAAAIVDRCDTIPDEIFSRLHGAIRSLRPAGFQPAAEDPPAELPWWDPVADASVDPWSDELQIGDSTIAKGSRVRLRPGRADVGGRRADAHDLFLAGRLATVQAVFLDVDGDSHVAVTLDDDPAAELYESHGRYLYFHPDEVEPLEQVW
jgi:hypothetical protein